MPAQAHIIFPKLARPETLFGSEWLVSGFAGSYSSSTALGINTRKYHGILASPDPKEPSKRYMVLQKIEERITFADGSVVELGSNFYPGAIYPRGHEKVQKAAFARDSALFVYDTPHGRLEKEIRMVEGDLGARVGYSFDFTQDAILEIMPKFNHRLVHSIETGPAPECEFYASGFSTKNGLLDMLSPECAFEPGMVSYKSCLYPRERERGYAFSEDLYSPGVFRKNGRAGRATIYAKAFFRHAVWQAGGNACVAGNGAQDDWMESELESSCASFMAKMPDGSSTVIAGYPWFFEWARDAMIFIDGALMDPAGHACAREMLVHFASMQKNGLVPNTSDYGSGSKPSADATLWFAYESLLYAGKSGDREFGRMIAPRIVSAISAYLKGTGGFGADHRDLLIETREGGLTWMDARDSSGKAFTPRIGKPVEVNALWHNCLALAAECTGIKQDERENLHSMAEETGRQMQKFYDENRECLKDLVAAGNGSHAEFEMRPNQIIAIGLEKNPFSKEKAARIIRQAEKELVTPYGLFSLSRSSPDFIGTYRGGQQERDRAYHNGAIWPYLLGFYFSARKSAGLVRKADLAFFNPMKKIIDAYGIGHVPELVEPDTFAPAGSPFQAWSDAQVLKAYSICKQA